MDIIVHNHRTLTSPGDVHGMYSTPVWEIEVKSDVLADPEFVQSLHNASNFVESPGHASALRSQYNGNDLVKSFLQQSHRDWLLDLVQEHPLTRPRYTRSRSYYQERSTWFATILRDQPGYKMVPHLDNSHIMIQMIVNLLQDNTTSTDFYLFDQLEPVYQAPTKQNHGVVFVNTPGAVHNISSVEHQRWILYAGVMI